MIDIFWCGLAKRGNFEAALNRETVAGSRAGGSV